MICSQSLCYNHRPIKRQPQLVRMSIRTPQNTWLRVAESTREGSKEAEARVDQAWARRPPAGTAWLASPSHGRGICFGRRRAEAWRPSGPPQLPCFESGIAYNRHFGVEELVVCSRKELLWVSGPKVGRLSLDIISMKMGLRHLSLSSVTSY